MRALASAAAAQLGIRGAITQLVELSLSVPVRVALCRDDIEWPVGSGNVFMGGRMVAIDAIRAQGGEIQGQSFQISGVPAELLAIALAEPVQGKVVRVWTVLMDADSQAILDAPQSWAGTLDQMPISQSGTTATITVTAEHRGVTFARPKGLRYTDGDQQRLYPGDKSLEFLIAQSTHQDVWPAAAFFRQ